MPSVHVTIRSPSLDFSEHWEELTGRSPGNVFLNPAALGAVGDTSFASVHVLLAWDREPKPEKLVGVWALQERRIAPLWPAFLAAPAYRYAFVSSPVVDPAYLGDVIPAFFDAIERHPALPNVIRLQYLDGDSETYPAIRKALDARESRMLQLSERPRPFLSRDVGRKRSGSTRKKLRQDWNRLSALGSVEIVNERTLGGVSEAFETFLAMEADSWKGARGTALLCNDADASFARRLVGNLARRRNASVALLRLDGRPIAAQVLLYCGRWAYTWKTAFDAEYAKYSPGALLVDRVADQLLSTEEIEAIESCSPEGGFLAQLWDGRRTTVDVLVDVAARRSLRFAAAAIGERVHAQLRRSRNRLRSILARAGTG